MDGRKSVTLAYCGIGPVNGFHDIFESSFKLTVI
jgi:hypothetical protein